jgi:hypothetical protein
MVLGGALPFPIDFRPIDKRQSMVRSNPFNQRFAILVAAIFLTAAWSAVGQTIAISDDAEQGIYEHYISNGWSLNSGTISVEQSVVHSGLYAYQISPNSNGYRAATINFSPAYLTCWVYIPSSYSLPSGSNTGNICALLSTTSFIINGVGVINSGGTLYLYSSGTKGTHAVTTNAWHFIQYEYASSFTAWLDGVQDITGTLTAETKNSILIGLNSSGTGSVYVDDITVSSAASTNPTAAITVRHAYPTNHTAIAVQTYLWGAASTDSLVTSIDGSSVSTISNPGTYQAPIVTLTGLTAGNHTLLVALNNSGGTQRASWTETIATYGGTPLVAIDGYNNLVEGGNKVFPITGWWTQGYGLNWVQSGYTNTAGWVSGWASAYSTSQYQTYMTGSTANSDLNCVSSGVQTIGPYFSRAAGFGTDAQNFAGYAAFFTKSPCVLGWFAYDEASTNGYTTSQMQGVMNAVHANDNNHPFFYDDATLPYLNLQWYYPYMVADIYSSDNYPLCYANTFHNEGKQLSDWVNEMDRDARANYGLAPNFQILEFYNFVNSGSNFDCSSNNSITGTAVSATTIYNEAWLAVIHGRKGISWYDNGSLTSAYGPVCATLSQGNCFPANPQSSIGLFTSTIASITPAVVLAAPTGRTVTSNMTSNCVASPYTTGQRVDATVRENSAYAYVFAARVTDPICSPSENTVASLSTNLTVSRISAATTATVLNESRTVPVSASGVITDSFAPWAVHLYQIPKNGGPPPPVLNSTTVTPTN